MLVGLAPGAHGSNRTGRMFTGDASGDFLYPALHRAGLATSPTSVGRDDGLRLQGVWITAAARCVPPGNAPSGAELETCRAWLAHDLDALAHARVIVALGRVAHDAVLKLHRDRGLRATLSAHPFAHGALHDLASLPGGAGLPPLLDSFHVSFQNTNTGRLTTAMFDDVLTRARALAAGASAAPAAGASPGSAAGA